MTVSGISLVDANVWLALAVDAHQHHHVALAWFDCQPEASCGFCRITQLALLRHLTNSKIMGSANVLSQEEAWQVYEAFSADPRVVFLDEPKGLAPAFRALSSGTTPAHKKWTDAFLAAFAICHSVEVVTFDADFQSLPGIKLRLLTSQP